MCGIAGFIHHQYSADTKKDLTFKMLESIVHRGPENSSVLVDGPVSLGHNRLKIIDLSDAANQPFEYQNLVLVFNGEIYNYIEIREELLKLGFSFRTSGDSEVLCAAYLAWGEACVNRFLGMWAFALWDKTTHKLFCSRDRFGIKPFYYISENANFYFASEYKALKVLPVFKNDLNIEQVKRGLAMVWGVYKTETYYEQIVNLEPAHNLVYENGSIKTYRYWDINLSAPKSNLSWEEKKAKFLELFEESIMLHSRSDVKNGTLLSGGLDSSAISSVYSNLFPNLPIKAFSIFYEGTGAVDERPFIRSVIDKYPQIEPNYYSPQDKEIEDSFYDVTKHADIPMLSSSFISQYFLMQLAKKEGVTVVINGQGADEYLGGYMHSFYRVLAQQFSELKWGNMLRTYSNNIEREQYGFKKSIDVALKSGASVFFDENGLNNLEYKQYNSKINGGKELCFEMKSKERFDNFLYQALFNTTLQTLLHFEDRNSMAFSLESRVPFLNHKLIEFCFSLQLEDRINTKAETKFVLRESLKNHLPEKVYNRKDKKGFVTPGDIRWLNGPLKQHLEIDTKQLDFLDKKQITREIERYKKGDHSNSKFVWRLVALDYWMKNFN
jgi:asparagine synthase (glutamine-hydrolysing)